MLANHTKPRTVRTMTWARCLKGHNKPAKRGGEGLMRFFSKSYSSPAIVAEKGKNSNWNRIVRVAPATWPTCGCSINAGKDASRGKAASQCFAITILTLEIQTGVVC